MTMKVRIHSQRLLLDIRKQKLASVLKSVETSWSAVSHKSHHSGVDAGCQLHSNSVILMKDGIPSVSSFSMLTGSHFVLGKHFEECDVCPSQGPAVHSTVYLHCIVLSLHSC